MRKSHNKAIRHAFFAALMAGMLALFIPMYASANIMVVPLRVLFNDRDRTADITLLNSSANAGVFRVGWMYRKLNPDNTYENIDGPLDPAFDPAQMIVFSPRQVRIQPGGRQRIRMSLRRPADLPPGEYHAHMRLLRLVGQDETERASDAPESGMALGVVANLGVAVPVVIRQGAYDCRVEITDARFIAAGQEDEKQPQIEMFLNRSGLHGAMGRVMVYWDHDGKEEIAGRMNNVSLFTEVSRLRVRIPLQITNIPGGTIRVAFEGDGPDRGMKYAEKTFPVGG